jgi:hypothetical protein
MDAHVPQRAEVGGVIRGKRLSSRLPALRTPDWRAS